MRRERDLDHHVIHDSNFRVRQVPKCAVAEDLLAVLQGARLFIASELNRFIQEGGQDCHVFRLLGIVLRNRPFELYSMAVMRAPLASQVCMISL